MKRSKRLMTGIAVIVIFVAVAGVVVGLRQSETSPGERIAQNPATQVNAASAEPEFLIPSQQIDAVRRSAQAGDNRAAETLANHYMALRERTEEKRWHSLAASRGNCASMSAMRQIAQEEHDESARTRWNDMMRRNVCTWAKTYPMFSNQEDASMPLWD